MLTGTSPDGGAIDNRAAVRFEYSPDFPGILRHLRASLAITTYQAGKLGVVGVDGDRLEF